MNSAELAGRSLTYRIRKRLSTFFGTSGLFFRGFLKHPVMVGSVIPTSDRTIRKTLRPVRWDGMKLFVEYGPGVGTFCQAVLDRLPRDGTYIAIDTNEDFVAYLNRSITDSRFIAVHGSAADVEEIIAQAGFEHADYILSGIPFSTLPDGVGPAIARSTFKALREGGAFITYQFSWASRELMRPYTDRIDSGFEVWNILPCKIAWGWKLAKAQ